VNDPAAINGLKTSEPDNRFFKVGLGSRLTDDVANAVDNGDIVVRGPCVGVALGDNGITVDSNHFSGFIIGNASISTQFFQFISNSVIKNNVITKTNDGIEILVAFSSTIEDNIIQGGHMIASEGVVSIGGGNNTRNNLISGFRDGVLLFIAETGTVVGNTISDVFHGVRMIANFDAGLPLNGVQVSDNDISDVGIGIMVRREGDVFPNDPTMHFDHTLIRNRIYNIESNTLFRHEGTPTSGIDLVLNDDFGLTPNDLLDGDQGPNNFQNFPVLTSVDGSFDAMSVNGTLNSELGKVYRIDFYVNLSISDAPLTKHGPGRYWLGSVETDPTDSNGNVGFSFSCDPCSVLDGVPPAQGLFVSTTATEMLDDGNGGLKTGSTSEFSLNVKAHKAK